MSVYCLVVFEEPTVRAEAKALLREHTDFIPLDPYDYVDAEYEVPSTALVNHLVRYADVMLVEDVESLLIGYATAVAHGFGIPVVAAGRELNDFWHENALWRHGVLSDAILNGVAPLGLPTL